MPVQCPKCSKSFRDQYVLDMHLNRKNPCDKKIQCGTCGMIFKSNRDLENHKNRQTPCVPPDEKHKCFYCKKNFSTKGNLDRHVEFSCKDRIQLEKEEEELSLLEQMEDMREKLEEQNQQIQQLQQLQGQPSTQQPSTHQQQLANNINNMHNGSNNTFNGDIHNGDNYNIAVHNYNEIKNDHITKEVLLEIARRNLLDDSIKIKDAGLGEYIDMCYFNKDIPNNMSFHMINERLQKARIKNNGVWEERSIGDVKHTVFCDSVNSFRQTKEQYKDYLIEEEGEDFYEDMTATLTANKDSKGNVKIRSVRAQTKIKQSIDNNMKEHKAIMTKVYRMDIKKTKVV